MSAARYDLYIEQGVDYNKSFSWQVGDPPATVDIQTYTGAMKIRDVVEDTAVILSLTQGSGITITIDDTFVIAMTHTQTSALDYAQGKKYSVIDPVTLIARDWYRIGVYDFEATSAGGLVTRLLYGFVYVSPEVTR